MSISKLDPRCPKGMNYLDWLMNVLKPDEMSPTNVDEIVVEMRRYRDAYESGTKIKKGDASPKIDLVKLKLKKAQPQLRFRSL